MLSIAHRHSAAMAQCDARHMLLQAFLLASEGATRLAAARVSYPEATLSWQLVQAPFSCICFVQAMPRIGLRSV